MNRYLNSQHRNTYTINCSPNVFVGFCSFACFWNFWKSVTENVPLQHKYSVYVTVHMFFYLLSPNSTTTTTSYCHPAAGTVSWSSWSSFFTCDWFLLGWFYSNNLLIHLFIVWVWYKQLIKISHFHVFSLLDLFNCSSVILQVVIFW